MTAALWNRIVLVLSFVGVFVAGVLSLAERLGADVPCGQSSGCAIVARDPSSHMLGFPNAYGGLALYIVLAGLAGYRELAGVKTAAKTILPSYLLALMGALVSGYLTYYSVSHIHATCKWCVGSAVCMVLLAIASVALAARAEGEAGDAKPALALVIALAVLSFGGIAAMAPSLTPITERQIPVGVDFSALVAPGSHVINPKGVVTLVEFGDLDCPQCRRAFPKIEARTSASDGKLRYVFHHYPLFQNPGHPGALVGAVCAEIAGESNSFWNYLGEVYSKQEENLPNGTQIDGPDADEMIQMLGTYGVSPQVAQRRITDPGDPARLRVQADIALANEFGVNATPTFILLAPGAKPREIAGITAAFDALDAEPYKKLLGGS